jgi:GH18 family chitinase
MKFYKYLLNEKTYDIDRDVDWLYNQGFKQLISYINKNNIKDAKKITDNEP